MVMLTLFSCHAKETRCRILKVFLTIVTIKIQERQPYQTSYYINVTPFSKDILYVVLVNFVLCCKNHQLKLKNGASVEGRASHTAQFQACCGTRAGGHQHRGSPVQTGFQQTVQQKKNVFSEPVNRSKLL